jgi:hypothetical protein
MKGTIQFVMNLVLLFAVQSYAAESLVIDIEVQESKVTSESVPFKVVVTNGGDRTISVLKPLIGRNLVVCICDKMGNQLARSAIPGDYVFDYGNATNKEYVSLAPRSCLKTETCELFSVVYPTFRITPGQAVRMDITYSLNGQEYKADAQIQIPPHDFEIKSEYISKERACAIAIQELKKRGYRMETGNYLEPKVQCINGIYRIIYMRKGAAESTHRGGGGVNIRIDAVTGNVLQLSMGRR